MCMQDYNQSVCLRGRKCLVRFFFLFFEDEAAENMNSLSFGEVFVKSYQHVHNFISFSPLKLYLKLHLKASLFELEVDIG